MKNFYLDISDYQDKIEYIMKIVDLDKLSINYLNKYKCGYLTIRKSSWYLWCKELESEIEGKTKIDFETFLKLVKK